MFACFFVSFYLSIFEKAVFLSFKHLSLSLPPLSLSIYLSISVNIYIYLYFFFSTSFFFLHSFPVTFSSVFCLSFQLAIPSTVVKWDIVEFFICSFFFCGRKKERKKERKKFEFNLFTFGKSKRDDRSATTCVVRSLGIKGDPLSLVCSLSVFIMWVPFWSYKAAIILLIQKYQSSTQNIISLYRSKQIHSTLSLSLSLSLSLLCLLYILKLYLFPIFFLSISFSFNLYFFLY